MGVFKELDPEVAFRAIEGYQDELAGDRDEKRGLYKNFDCPRCKCSLQEEFDARTAFTGGTITPKAVLRCADCSYCIDPFTGVVVAFGDASKTPYDMIPIIGGKYIT